MIIFNSLIGLLRNLSKGILPMGRSRGIAPWLIAALVTAGAKGVDWLGKKAGWWGGEPKPPDIGAERFGYDNKWIEDWTQAATTDVTRQSEQFLQKAMQGIHGAEHARGLTEGGGWAGGKGTEAAEFGAENLATALANIKSRAAGMEHAGMMQGQELYGKEYQDYLNRLYQDQEDWVASIMNLIPSGGDSSGGGTPSWPEYGGGY